MGLAKGYFRIAPSSRSNRNYFQQADLWFLIRDNLLECRFQTGRLKC